MKIKNDIRKLGLTDFSTKSERNLSVRFLENFNIRRLAKFHTTKKYKETEVDKRILIHNTGY